MRHPRVIARIPNILADLLAWGRDFEGWWALAMWEFRDGDGMTGGPWIRRSAWMPATTMEPSSDPQVQRAYLTVVWLELPLDRSAWPVPARRTGWSVQHLGVIESADAAMKSRED